MEKKLSPLLVKWYKENARPLPWRKDRNPYKIWISEVMLQQTTVTAVIPYFNNFISQFPTVQSLAVAEERQVLKNWAGLGYYSRARNLHKASKIIAASDFPQTWSSLIELPGFGPYTSRAVASLAFDEAVGVLDGNVIRVLSRLYNLAIPWWSQEGRAELQLHADRLASVEASQFVNQGLMELGATICTPQNPSCTLCPWLALCKGVKAKTVSSLPLKKPKRDAEIWQIHCEVKIKNGKIFLAPNESTPFLKKAWFPPMQAKKLKLKPKTFSFTHSVTHHKIFVNLVESKAKPHAAGKWFKLTEISEINPSSLIKKMISTTPKRSQK